MNATVYLFGKFNQEYFQYPNDYTQEIFAKMSSYATAKTQICIHRQRELMYYAYIRRLETSTKGDYLGLCIILNDLIVSRIELLFNAYEALFSDIVSDGRILGFNTNGEVEIRKNPTSLKNEEQEWLMRTLRARISCIKEETEKLPPVQNGISSAEVRNFVFEDINTEEMVLSSYTYEYVVIFKDKNYESLTFQTSRDTIQRLNREKEEALQRSTEFLSKGKESKHPLLISALVTSLIVLSISIIAIIGNSRNNLWQKEQLISNYERQFGILKDSVDKLQKEITRKNALEKNLRQELESVLKERTSMRNVLDSMKYVNQKIYYNYRYYGYNNSYSTDYGINPSYVYVDKINPPVSRKSPGNRNLVIKRVQVASNRTIVDLEYTNLEYSRGWISINHDTYITSDSGDKQRLMMTVGIPFSPQKRYLSFREKVTFRLIFPAISSNTSDFDLIEENSPWKFYGIRLWQ